MYLRWSNLHPPAIPSIMKRRNFDNPEESTFSRFHASSTTRQAPGQASSCCYGAMGRPTPCGTKLQFAFTNRIHYANDPVKAYISGNALVILSGPHTLIQTLYNDQLLALEAVVIDEATGKIAICSLEEVYIFKPYGKKEGALKVRPETRDSRPSCEVLTIYSGHFSPLCSFQATKMAR